MVRSGSRHRPTVVLSVNAFRHGGSQTYAIALAQLLHEHDVDVVFVGKRGALSDRFRRTGPTIHVHWREGEPRHGRQVLKDLVLRVAEASARRRLRRSLRGPHVVIASQPYPIAFFVRLAEGSENLLSVSALVHGTTSVEWPPACDPRDVDTLFAANAATAEFVARQTGRPVENLGNLFSASVHWADLPPQEPGDFILFLGTLTPNKTPPLRALLTSLEADEHLIVCGNGPDRNELEHLARRSRGHVTFVGAVDDPRPLIAQASVVVSAGRGAIESLAIGRPVVVASSEGIHGAVLVEDLAALQFHNYTGRTPQSLPSDEGHIRAALDAARSASADDLDQLATLHAQVGDIGPVLALLEAAPRR